MVDEYGEVDRMLLRDNGLTAPPPTRAKARALVAAGENARAVDARARDRADLAKFMLLDSVHSRSEWRKKM